MNFLFLLHKLLVFQPFSLNGKTKIVHESINAFILSSKQFNDKNNKIREHVIETIINDNIPTKYYDNPEWLSLRNKISQFVTQLGSTHNDNETAEKVECIRKGGRKFNYDFVIKYHYRNKSPRLCKVEFKYGVDEIEDAPQFVSPMRPSQYLTNSYEEYYFDKYLPELSSVSGFSIPPKYEYLQQIHTDKPECMSSFQDLYYRGCKNSCQYTGEPKAIQFYQNAKVNAKKSIETFIEQTDILDKKLSDYLVCSQHDKNYMLYNGGKIVLQTANPDDYTIDKVEKQPEKCRWVATSFSGKRINILLRWKNGNGIAFPAFQIQ